MSLTPDELAIKFAAWYAEQPTYVSEEESYIAGYTAALRDSEAVGWISVDERVPEIKDFYLVAEDGGQVRVAFFVKGTWIGSISETKAITHWMPLPAAPAITLTANTGGE